MLALIDGDIAVYRVGFTTNEEPVGISCARMDTFMKNIVRWSEADSFKCFLTSTDKSNFRFKLYPEYKANRKQPKPTWYHELREHLIHEYDAEVVYGREADDALADAQTDASTCICSIDKDLDQIAGAHYDFSKNVRYTVDPRRGRRYFFLQLLAGDSTDNIPGVTGIGVTKAAKILDATDGTDSGLFEAVRRTYGEVYGPRGDELMLLYGRLVKIGGDIWDDERLRPASTDPASKGELDPSLSQKDTSTNPST